MAGFDPALLNRVCRCPDNAGVAVTVVVWGQSLSPLPSGSPPGGVMGSGFDVAGWGGRWWLRAIMLLGGGENAGEGEC